MGEIRKRRRKGDSTTTNMLGEIPSQHEPQQCRSVFEDGMVFLSYAAQALAKDEFYQCFEPEPIQPSPTHPILFLFYVVGVFIRYCILFPLRYPQYFIAIRSFPITRLYLDCSLYFSGPLYFCFLFRLHCALIVLSLMLN